MTPILIKSFRAAAAIAGNVIVSAQAVREAVTANGAAAPSIGVSDGMGAKAGGMCDIVQVGWGEVRAGGNVAIGDPLTADAQGRAIKAVPTAGTNVRVVGIAQADAALGDIFPLLIAPSVIPASA
jgi:Uncharacterized conserved protein (DUF2190)